MQHHRFLSPDTGTSQSDTSHVKVSLVTPTCEAAGTSFSARLSEDDLLMSDKRPKEGLVQDYPAIPRLPKDEYHKLMSQMSLGQKNSSFNVPKKKYSHPGILLPDISSSSNSPPRTPRLSPRKKISLPGLNLPVPVSIRPFDDDVTKSLESAVRKMSRGNSPLMGTSPNNRGGETFSGLTGLAKGYEQYRESLLMLHPSTEFGEASSDDLSSEWESSDKSETADPSCVVLKESVTSTLMDNYRRRKLMMSQQLQGHPSHLTNSSNLKSNKDDDDDEDETPKLSNKRVSVILAVFSRVLYGFPVFLLIEFFKKIL